VHPWGPDAETWWRRGRSSGRPPGTMAAAHAVALVAAVLGLMALFDARGLVRTGEGMPPGRTRTLVLAVGRPVAALTGALRLGAPVAALERAVGSDGSGFGGGSDQSELITGLPPTVTRPGGGTPGGAGGPGVPAGGSAGPSPSPSPAAGAGAGSSPGPRTTPGRTGGTGSGPAPVWTPRPVTASAPLRLLVTGDSLSEPIGPALSRVGGDYLRVDRDTHAGTGLARPDYFDWAATARAQIDRYRPDAVVVTLGGNDGQGITLPGGKVLDAGTPAWAAEYQRRAAILMRIWTGGGARPLYWMTLPIARPAVLDADYRMMQAAVDRAARAVPGTRIVDVTGRLAAGGRYSDYLRDDEGHLVLARMTDGVHYTMDGARIAAGVMMPAIARDWHLPTGR